jgi:hypothetical protein
MDIQALQTEIRDYLLNQALNDLSVIRWTLVEERMHGEDGAQYLDALLAYRDAKIASLRAHKEYKDFIQKHQMHWEQEEELYYNMGRYKALSTRAEQQLNDLILASDSYKKMVQESVELPDYG